MRALIYGAAIIAALATAPALAGDVRQFEIKNLRLGMTVAEIKEAGKQAGLGEFREMRSPSFEQAVAMKQQKNIRPTDFAGVQTMHVKTSKAAVHVSLVPTPDGSKVWRIAYSFLDPSLNREALRENVFRQYGEPERQIDREWLWGDTTTFFDARKSPYLEFRLDPTSMELQKPVGMLTLADPTMERSSREAVDIAARK